ncbi:MAG: type II toxin-antitoxin system HicA family toxin [Synergistaceae bacterium]|jgi:predicted RNA binding protein YcfA (HicA-like mRNA interferase family)|nr:type II toxin-antitoxin system HicA family toxin [Synergistaceae bacterium]
MSEIPSSEEIIRKLKADGWLLDRITGSRHHFKHPDKPGIVTIAHPKKDIPPDTLGNVKRQSELK